MQVIRLFTLVPSCFLLLSCLAWAQQPKPGLWDVTATQTWQQSPFPPGARNRMDGEHKSQVCLTQQDIDKFGTAPPSARYCKVTNIDKKPTSMSAEMECTGAMSGKGTFEASWSDSEHSKGNAHFMGSIGGKPVQWTIESTSVFKSSDCGNVKSLSQTEK